MELISQFFDFVELVVGMKKMRNRASRFMNRLWFDYFNNVRIRNELEKRKKTKEII